LCDVVIMGLGHAGLPLARRACEAGLSVVGYDTSAQVVRGLNAGLSHIGDVPHDAVAGMVSAGFVAVSDAAVIDEADTVVICVPTGLDERGEPDLGAVRAASRTVAARLRPGRLVVLESTSHPGTTEEIVRPLLETGSGLRVGIDFHLAFSPERIDPGNPLYGVRNTPKVVGGCTPLCAKYAVAFFSRFVDSVVVSRGTREAEMAKLLENTYRYVNIALVDEIASYCERVGIDVWDVLYCAASKPFGYAPFRPGPGVGGHCIPVDPLYLATKAAQAGHTFRMLSAAQEVHAHTPRSVAHRAMAMLTRNDIPVRGAGVVVLGVTYKADVADIRHTPAEAVIRELRAHAARVSYHDPHVASFEVDGIPVPSVGGLPALSDADIAILLQDHSCFEPSRLATAGCLVLDTRGSLPDVPREMGEMRAPRVTHRLRQRFRCWDTDGDGLLAREDFDSEGVRIAVAFGRDPAAPESRVLRDVLLAMFDDLARWAGRDPGERISETQFLSVTENLIYIEGEAAFNRLLRPMVEALIGLCGGDRMGQQHFTAWLTGVGVDRADAVAAFTRIGGGHPLSAAQTLAAVREFHFGRTDVGLLA
jgi:UDP-N-acetyl-D-glucosamine dehydrogenase